MAEWFCRSVRSPSEKLFYPRITRIDAKKELLTLNFIRVYWRDSRVYDPFNKEAASWSAESLLPPSMRAISSCRALPVTSRRFEKVRPRTTSFVTTKWDEAEAATGARWVMQIN